MSTFIGSGNRPSLVRRVRPPKDCSRNFSTDAVKVAHSGQRFGPHEPKIVTFGRALRLSKRAKMQACHPGREREGRGTPNAAAITRSPRTQEQDDTRAVGPAALRGKIASFGPFRLHVIERLLEKNDVPVEIGSRALDILVTLLEQAPEVVSKHDLNRRAWGRLIVDEGSIRAQIARLRDRLDDGDSAVSYIANIPGRGYCFTGAVAWSVCEATARKAPMAALHLPRGPLLMVGRDDAVRELTARLKKQRFVSIVGAGGIGKTTVALALAHRMLGEFQGAIHFLDLGALKDPRLLASMLAHHLGVVAVS